MEILLAMFLLSVRLYVLLNEDLSCLCSYENVIKETQNVLQRLKRAGKETLKINKEMLRDLWFVKMCQITGSNVIICFHY